MFWIYTNYHYSSMTANNATFRTHFFYRWTNFHNRPHLNSIIEFETLHTSYNVEDHFILRANDGDRTREWWSHSPLPYHLATPARHLVYTISKNNSNVYTFISFGGIFTYLTKPTSLDAWRKEKTKERITWLEHATSNLEGWHSTIELYPLVSVY